MSKELKALEAFNLILELLRKYEEDNPFSIKKPKNMEGYIETIQGYPVENISNSLKALEIIKEKGLSFIEIALLKCCSSYEEYNCEIADRCYKHSFENEKAHKTREEFDLLKEVLCKDNM